MNADWMIFESQRAAVAHFRRLNRTHLGYLYALEIGSRVKIGYSTRPASRLAKLANFISVYGSTESGRVAISPPHSNARENERQLHEFFASKRIRGEQFGVTIEEVILRGRELTYLHEPDNRPKAEFVTTSEEIANDPFARLFLALQAKSVAPLFTDFVQGTGRAITGQTEQIEAVSSQVGTLLSHVERLLGTVENLSRRVKTLESHISVLRDPDVTLADWREITLTMDALEDEGQLPQAFEVVENMLSDLPRGNECAN